MAEVSRRCEGELESINKENWQAGRANMLARGPNFAEKSNHLPGNATFGKEKWGMLSAGIQWLDK